MRAPMKRTSNTTGKGINKERKSARQWPPRQKKRTQSDAAKEPQGRNIAMIVTQTEGVVRPPCKNKGTIEKFSMSMVKDHTKTT